MAKDCLTCNYIAEELEIRKKYCEDYDDVCDEGLYCWCDKVGGKISIFGTCIDGGFDIRDDEMTIAEGNKGRGISYRRNERAKHIARKKRICNEKMVAHPLIPHKSEKNKTYYTSDFSKDLPGEWYDVDGKYDKGKIHCGCPLCKPYKGYYPSWKQKRINKDTKLLRKEWELESEMMDETIGIAT